ncbi:Siderophore triacetylfusarinine C esterase [Paramyrothecium foliicola]|nr:Siderophore triacetylfusarinine C esterase [Paramyrothecium foliicola]
MFTQNTPFGVESAESWTVQSASGLEYLVQIGFPRDWVEQQQKRAEPRHTPVLYLTDGNSVFLTALDSLHRLLSIRYPTYHDGVVVAIGYPLLPNSRSVFDIRRAWDLTPKFPGGKDSEGGADDFIDFIQDRVKPLVRSRLGERYGVAIGREALYGHSYGGLFSLYTLFTKPDLFDCFIASSPSIWWNKQVILEKEAQFRSTPLTARPSLMLFIGGDEQSPPRRRDQLDEEYERLQKQYSEWKMVDQVSAMYTRMTGTDALQRLSMKVYPGEDHGTVIACSVNQSLVTFFDDWPLLKSGMPFKT